MKKRKKAYLSSNSIQKGFYKNKLQTRYNLIFADNLREADILIVPVELTLTPKQELDIDAARFNKIHISILSSDTIIRDKFHAILDKEFLEENKEFEKEEQRELRNLEDDLDYGMELRL